MKLTQRMSSFAAVMGLTALVFLLSSTSSTAAKGKPSGGGGGSTNFAFVFEVVGDGLFLTTIDDGNRVRLTRAQSRIDHIEPQWSPDLDPDTDGYQGMIAYIELTDNGSNLNVVKPDGSGDRVLRAAISGSGLAWTPNGKEIVLQQFNRRIIAVEVSTGNLRVLWDNLDNTGPSIRTIAISPLGDLAFDRDGDVYVVDYSLNGDGLIELDPTTVVNMTGPDTWETAPSFSPDGTYLAYSRLPGPDALWQVVVLDLLSLKENVVLGELSGDRCITWSPDGSQLGTYIRTYSNRGPSMELYRITDWNDPAKRRVIQITNTKGSNSNHEVTPAWSPGWLDI